MARASLFAAAAACLLLALAAAPAAAQSCTGNCACACSCAFGIKFGESLCNYANFTADVKEYQEALMKPEPDFTDALKIYSQGRNSIRNNASRPWTGVTARNYGDEAFYKTSAAYFQKEFYIDSFIGPALRGDGDYAGACCGVRAEVAKAGARWFLGAYSIHEVDAGVCYATGCNNRTISKTLAGEEILHGIALMSGADSDAIPDGPGGSGNPFNLFQETNAASAFYCTAKKAGRGKPLNLSPSNAHDIQVHEAASAAAEALDLPKLAQEYAKIEGAMVARFLQYSLESAYEASKPASKGVLKKADACHSPCLRKSQQAAARTYFRAVEPIIARANAGLVTDANALLGAESPAKTYKPLAKVYKAIIAALGMDAKVMLAKCKA
ncbi:MAG: hypothetical protein J3K34DRAFT_458970 [Monoraphidium minutum]|nr:MAG: hypothetical protein J3K34DRAFT_458970 [Monoraphidium minutum]